MGSRKSWSGVFACALLVIVVVSARVNFAQTRYEQPKPGDKKTASPAPADANTKPDDDKNLDPNFKGMKYRLVGPFRGGRCAVSAARP